MRPGNKLYLTSGLQCNYRRKEKRMKKLSFSTKLLIAGIVIVVLAPYVPDIFYTIVYHDLSPCNYHWKEWRMAQIIPSVQIAGIILSAWGLVLKRNEKNNKGDGK